MVTFRPPGNEVNESNFLHLPVSRSPPALLLCGQGADVLPRVWSCRLALQDICKTSQELQASGSSLCAAHVVIHWLLHVRGIA